jgi:drug/metabolite transporter (DMT)-like permease
MFEPGAGTVIAYAWLREELDPIQLVGAAVVLCGIGLAQTAR